MASDSSSDTDEFLMVVDLHSSGSDDNLIETDPKNVVDAEVTKYFESHQKFDLLECYKKCKERLSDVSGIEVGQREYEEFRSTLKGNHHLYIIFAIEEIL